MHSLPQANHILWWEQVAAAKAPQVLAPRRRKAVNYNEAKLHRKYVTDSESEATAAEAGSEGADDSNTEDGPQNKVNIWLTYPTIPYLRLGFNLYCMYLVHHELESVLVMVVICIIILYHLCHG